MMPTQQNQQQNQQPPVPPPEPKYRFRWPILAVVLTILVFFWVLKGVTASFRFREVLDFLTVVHKSRYARLACFAIVLIAVTLIIKTVTK